MITVKKGSLPKTELTIKDKYCFFWGQWPSNWTNSPFILDDVEYNCVEQFMMAEKARVFNDFKTRAKILKTKNPKEQKELGRQVKNYDDTVWSEVRYDIVVRGTLEKYRQNEKLKEKLLRTGTLVFVEASPYDKIWGIGLAEGDSRILDETKWQGLNLLGKVITECRDILAREL